MKTYPMIDLHQDLMLHIKRPDLFSSVQTSFEMLEQTNVKITVATAFPVPENEHWFDVSANDLIEEDFQSYIDYCKEHPQWIIIKTKKDAERVMNTEGLFGLILHIEGLNVFSGTDSQWERLERWYHMGWRSLGMVWNVSNDLAGGTLDPKKGLTELGVSMVRWLEKKRMIIDFAHMNAPTFEDVAAMTSGPIWISHGNCRALCDHPRNYSDEQLKLLVKRGGVLGPFFSGKYVADTSPVKQEDVEAHFIYAKNLIGTAFLASGSDFGGITTGLPVGLETVCDLPALWKSLAEGGFSDQDLEAITHKNAYQLLRHILPD